MGASLGNIFLGVDDKKPDKKNKLVQILPFLDDDDIHEIVEDILSDPDKYDGLNLCAIMPFLSENDCDALFLEIALDNDKNIRTPSLLLRRLCRKSVLQNLSTNMLRANFKT